MTPGAARSAPGGGMSGELPTLLPTVYERPAAGGAPGSTAGARG